MMGLHLGMIDHSLKLKTLSVRFFPIYGLLFDRFSFVMVSNLFTVLYEKFHGMFVLHNVAIATTGNNVVCTVHAIIRIDSVQAVVMCLCGFLSTVRTWHGNNVMKLLIGQTMRLGVCGTLGNVTRSWSFGNVVPKPVGEFSIISTSTTAMGSNSPTCLHKRKNRPRTLH